MKQENKVIEFTIKDLLLECNKKKSLEKIKTILNQQTNSETDSKTKFVDCELPVTDDDYKPYFSFPLVVAAYNGSDEVLRCFLDDFKANIDLQTSQGQYTALHWAILKGHLSTVKLLCEKGADLSLCTEKGFNAGTAAVYLYLNDKNVSLPTRIQIIEVILKTDPNIAYKEDNQKRTILTLASNQFNLPLIQAIFPLLTVDKSQFDTLYNTFYNHKDLILIIVKKAINFRLIDLNHNYGPENKQTILEIAVEKNDQELVNYLINKQWITNDISQFNQIYDKVSANPSFTLTLIKKAFDLEIIDLFYKLKTGETILEFALQKFDKKFAALLINKTIQTLDLSGFEEIYNTVYQDKYLSLTLVKQAVERNIIQTDYKLKNIQTILELAVETGDAEFTKALINDKKVDNIKTYQGDPLIFLALHAPNETVLSFFKHGLKADFTVKNKNDQTLLEVVANSLDETKIKWLLNNIKWPQEIIIQVIDNVSRLISTRSSYKAIVDLLIPYLEPLKIDFARQCGYGNLEEVKKIYQQLQEKNISITNPISDQEYTQKYIVSLARNDLVLPLLLATLSNESKVVKFLIEEVKIPIDQQDQEGRFALIIAIENRHNELVNYFLEKKPNVLLKTKKGNSVLDAVFILENYDALELLKTKCLTEMIQLLPEKLRKCVDEDDLKTLQAIFTHLEEKAKAVMNQNVFFDDKYTLLHYAVSKNKPKVVDMLLKNGANRMAISKDGQRTPLQMAESGNYTDIINLLKPKKSFKDALSMISDLNTNTKTYK